MLSTLAIVAPIFALIAAGWAARRSGVLGVTASSELNRFVAYLALPALLFDIMSGAHWSQVWRPGLVAAFGLGVALVFAATVGFRIWRGRRLADAAVDGLNAAYANTAFIGFPLLAAALGPSGLVPTLIATILTVCILLAVAMVLVEIGLQAERGGSRPVLRVARSLAVNPLLLAPLAGGLVSVLGLSVPTPADRFLDLLGAAASPCALVAIGLFLAAERPASGRAPALVAGLVSLKLLGQPVVTWVLAALVFRLPPPQVHAAVLLAALPTGTGPFMLAEAYGREAGATSKVVLVSTIASIVTVSAYLALAVH